MIHKKKKEEGKFRLFQPYLKRISAVFSMFQPFPACFDRIGPNMADTARFWPNQPSSAQIKADSTQIEPRRCELSRVDANPRKKKKNADADRHSGNRIGRRILHWAASNTGAAPLVLRPCFLVLLQEDYI